MALEYSKTNLGKLFGGYIASINYSLGTGNESNSCTITVVSENNQFKEPKLDEVISVPPFSISMKVVEFTIRSEINKKVLQVELTDQISEILDKQLVLIYGIHTDPFFSMNNDLYFESKSIYIDRSQWPKSYRFNPSVKLAEQLPLGFSANLGNGKNVIGTSRVSRAKKAVGYMTSLDTAVKTRPAQVAVYEGGFLKQSLSSFYEKDFAEWNVTKDNESNIQFGYTLFDLKMLFQRYGLSFSGLDFQKSKNNKIGNKKIEDNNTQGSSAIMSNTALFFSDSGTFREVLASCLNKIGRTFYIDPFSQNINIVSNADISKINSNLESKYSDGISIEGATQKSISKSISDVEAIHIVLKGTVDENINENNREPISSSSEGKKYYETFYRFKKDSFEDFFELKNGDILFGEGTFGYLNELNNNETLLNNYIVSSLFYSLEEEQNQDQDHDFYGENFCEFSEQNSAFKKLFWQESFKKEKDNIIFNFDKKSLAQLLYRIDPNDFTNANRIPAILPKDTDFLEKTNAYSKFINGVYFSKPDPIEDLSRKSYETQNVLSEESLESLSLNIVALDDLVSQVDFLSFLKPFFLERPNLTVRDLAKEAWPEDLIGPTVETNSHVAIAIKNPIEKQLDSLADILESIICTRIIREGEKIYFIYHKNDAMKKIGAKIKASQNFLEQFIEDERLRIKYTKIKDGEEKSADLGGGADDKIDFDEKGISTIDSKSTNFSSRSIKLIENNKFQMEILKNNIQDIMPEFTGPSIKVSIDYFRPPKKEDLNLEDGVNSLSVSISPDGITTSVNYSSIRYKEIDFNLLSETYGFKQGLIINKPQSLPAFKRK